VTSPKPSNSGKSDSDSTKLVALPNGDTCTQAPSMQPQPKYSVKDDEKYTSKRLKELEEKYCPHPKP
jgi:hypothetical protein